LRTDARQSLNNLFMTLDRAEAARRLFFADPAASFSIIASVRLFLFAAFFTSPFFMLSFLSRRAWAHPSSSFQARPRQRRAAARIAASAMG